MPGFHIPGVGLHLIKERKQFLGAGARRGLCFRESKIAVRDFLFFPFPTLCTTIAR